jgi:hypothetical protein
MSGSPQRMFLAAVAIPIGFSRNVLSSGAWALLEPICVYRLDFFLRDGLDIALS